MPVYTLLATEISDCSKKPIDHSKPKQEFLVPLRKHHESAFAVLEAMSKCLLFSFP